jgi:FHS family L-fucose permease-like MFS transporter
MHWVCVYLGCWSYTSDLGLLVTILFFLWGFAYGLLDMLNSHIQTALNITASKYSGLQASYFGAYFICPLTISRWTARKYGFRVTFTHLLEILSI